MSDETVSAGRGCWQDPVPSSILSGMTKADRGALQQVCLSKYLMHFPRATGQGSLTAREIPETQQAFWNVTHELSFQRAVSRKPQLGCLLLPNAYNLGRYCQKAFLPYPPILEVKINPCVRAGWSPCLLCFSLSLRSVPCLSWKGLPC